MIRKTIDLTLCPWQASALHNGYRHFAMLGGVAIGKSFTGAQFAIYHMVHHSDKTGFIGANTHDQLSQVSLRELFYWMDELRMVYVIGRMPPPSWNEPRKFKSYENILSVRVGSRVVYVFTRVLSHGDNLRGLEFSWYWIDETRDTPLNTHDVILSRLRETDYIKGLVTTTPGGEDWVWNRFVKNGGGAYGCSHTPTADSVRYGVITKQFYLDLRRSYSPVMAAQELDAKHVTVRVGRAYYTYDERNRESGYVPNEAWPLVVGMDFNYSPSPMCWAIGQYDYDNEKMHWFDELVDDQISSREMARRLGMRYLDWRLEIYGDASGERGTTSNAGDTDFNQIADELNTLGVDFTMDTQQMNPLVRDRVENMCRLGCDANGEVWMYVDPDRCPLLWQDLNKVIWKNGKLSADKGDADVAHLLTHCSDGAGYAMWKVCPPDIAVREIGKAIPSLASQMGD